MSDDRPARLSANRDYNLLWAGQVVSELGSQISIFVFPLLVVSMTGSPAQAGLVAALGATARVAVGLPAGAVVDRWNRKKVMLSCEIIRGVAMATVVIAIVADSVTVAHIVVVAVLEGACAAFFLPAEQASLPNVVRSDQLSIAIARNSARSFLATLVGPGIAGVLLGAQRILPFLANAGFYLVSFVALIFVRIPRRVVEERASVSALPGEIAAGLVWIWRHPVVRMVILLATAVNLLFTAIYLVVVLSAQRDGIPTAEIGAIGTLLGVGGLAGALVAPKLHTILRPHVSMAAMMWTCAVLTPVLVVLSNGFALGGMLAVMAFLAPTVTTTVMAQLMVMTPDSLRGRMTSTVALASSVAGVIGPLSAGLLVQFAAGAAVFLCAGAMGLLAVIATFSATLRGFPVPEAAQGSLSQSDSR